MIGVSYAYVMEVHAYGSSAAYRTRVEPNQKDSVEFSVCRDGDCSSEDVYFCRLTQRGTLACVDGDSGSEFRKVKVEWNMIHEVWALELPQGQVLRGYWGSGNAQQLVAGAPLSAKGNRKLVRKARQVFFPVKNPLWVRRYQNLLP
jgi:hypothetical protein